MEVQVVLLIELGIDSEHGGTTPHDGHRRLDGFLHHVAELAGVDQLALARHDRRLDGQQLATDFGPCEAGDLPDLIVLFGAAVAKAPDAEIFPEGARHDMNLLVPRLE